MSKSFVVCLAILGSAGLAVAQPAVSSDTQATSYTVLQGDANSTRTADAGTTATADVASTGTATADQASSVTNASRMFTEEQFNRRWTMEESMYREAGIPDAKIQKLKDLNSKIWKARASGGKGDFQAIMKQRAEILTQEEVQKIRDMRRSQIEKQLNEAKQDAPTPATENAK